MISYFRHLRVSFSYVKIKKYSNKKLVCSENQNNEIKKLNFLNIPEKLWYNTKNTVRKRCI
ncbi:hypothetical protein D2E16_06330 [Streptococcus suis]|nr:hypothetical protein D2E16_06330 [Streptococcus suis]